MTVNLVYLLSTLFLAVTVIVAGISHTFRDRLVQARLTSVEIAIADLRFSEERIKREEAAHHDEPKFSFEGASRDQLQHIQSYLTQLREVVRDLRDWKPWFAGWKDRPLVIGGPITYDPIIYRRGATEPCRKNDRLLERIRRQQAERDLALQAVDRPALPFAAYFFRRQSSLGLRHARLKGMRA